METKILCVADLHIGAGRKYKNYLERYESMLWGILENVISSGYLIIAGDIFDRSPFLEEYNLFLQFINELILARIHTIIITGNHDWIDKNRTYLDILERIPIYQSFITFAKKNKVIENWGGLCSVDLRPWNWERTDWKSPPQGDILVGHFPVNSAKTFSGYTIENDINPSFSREHTFVLGDIHFRQKLTQNAVYCGSPIQHNLGEAPSPKGGWWLSYPSLIFETWDLDSKPLPSSKPKTTISSRVQNSTIVISSPLEEIRRRAKEKGIPDKIVELGI